MSNSARRAIRNRTRPGHCPTCGKPIILYKRHPDPEQAGWWLYGCSNGHGFKKFLGTPTVEAK